MTLPPGTQLGPYEIVAPLGDGYRTLLDRRDCIERVFSALCCSGGGLTTLPAWVRRLDRVTRWVSAKIAIYHARLCVRQAVA